MPASEAVIRLMDKARADDELLVGMRGNRTGTARSNDDNTAGSDESALRSCPCLTQLGPDTFNWHAASGEVPAREGVIRLMDEARADGLLVGVCSAATKSSAICVLKSLLGEKRFNVSRQAIQQKPTCS